MISKAALPFRLFKWLSMTIYGAVRDFFCRLRNVDVDEVGTAIFKHCTSPKALYVTLFERWWIVCVLAFCGICMGAYLIKTSVESYESHGSILIYQKMPTFMDDKVMLPDPKAYDSLFSTHVQLIGSPMIVERAIEQHDLVEKCLKITESLDTEEDETFEDYIRKNLKISRAGSGDSAGAFVINVGFGHIDSTEVPLVVDAILDSYRKYVNESLLFDQRKSLDLVKKTKDELEDEVRVRNQAYRDFLKTAPGVWNRLTENNPHQANVEQLETELTEAELTRISVCTRIEIMKQTHDPTSGKPLTDIARLALIDEEHIQRLGLLAKIKNEEASADALAKYPGLQETESVKFDVLLSMYGERAELLKNIGPTHPTILDLDANITETETRLAGMRTAAEPSEVNSRDLVDAYVRMLDKELQAITAKIAFIEARIKEEIGLAHQLTDFTEKAKHMKLEYEQSLAMHQSVMDKVTKQNLLEEYGNFIAEIVARPHHISITWPKKPVILALCTILGIFAGSFISIALDLIAYSPLRKVFWFIPRWLLGGNGQTNEIAGPADEPAVGSEIQTAESETHGSQSPPFKP